MKDCKYYCKDYQLEGMCKLHSDWSEAMPTIEYCLLGPCGDYEIDFDCKWYKDNFCVNADSPCAADYCPCTEYPDLCKYYESKQDNLKKRKPDQLPGQTDVFDIIDNKTE